MKCGACGRVCRTRTRALLLTGPGKIRPALVCRDCESTGWLLVFAFSEPIVAGERVDPICAVKPCMAAGTINVGRFRICEDHGAELIESMRATFPSRSGD